MAQQLGTNNDKPGVKQGLKTLADISPLRKAGPKEPVKPK